MSGAGVDTHPSAPRLIHWAGTASLGMIWGASFMGMAVALEGFTPLWVAALRLVFGATSLGIVLRLRGSGQQRDHATLPWPSIIGIAAFGAILPFMLLTWGLQYVPSSFAGVSMASVALMILPLAHVFVPGEQMTILRTLGVGLGFLGVVFLFGADVFAGTFDPATWPGRLACLLAAFCYATSSILTRRCPPVDPFLLATLMTSIGAGVMVLAALFIDGPPQKLPVIPFVALLGLGILGTGFANLVRVLIVRSAGPGFMSLTAYQIPVWSIIFGAWILSEPVPPQLLLSLVLILGGIALTQERQLKLLAMRLARKS